MGYKPRIFISCLFRLEPGSFQEIIKEAFIEKIRSSGYEPEIFEETGLAKVKNWNIEELHAILRKCDGAVILGLSKPSGQSEKNIPGLPTVYNNYEGAYAASLKLPLLILPEQGVEKTGIFYNDQVNTHYEIPLTADKDWFEKDTYFNRRFEIWMHKVNSRSQVFVGYSGDAGKTARIIIELLDAQKLRVIEYQTTFRSARNVLEEIDNASKKCQCAIFLFTKDDELEGDEKHAAPRDNVIFEAGYFIKALGLERVLIIKEHGAKMPADLGGVIYESFTKREDISDIIPRIEKFLSESLYYNNIL